MRNNQRQGNVIAKYCTNKHQRFDKQKWLSQRENMLSFLRTSEQLLNTLTTSPEQGLIILYRWHCPGVDQQHIRYIFVKRRSKPTFTYAQPFRLPPTDSESMSEFTVGQPIAWGEHISFLVDKYVNGYPTKLKNWIIIPVRNSVIWKGASIGKQQKSLGTEDVVAVGTFWKSGAYAYRKMLLTEQSSYTRHIVSPKRLATDNIVSCGK